jgi:signal transduction histidine kinase
VEPVSDVPPDGQQLADLLPEGVVIADADGRVTLASVRAAQMLGTTPERCVGQPLAEVLALPDQDGQDWFTGNAPYDGLSTRVGIPEQSWLLPDGTEVLVAARIHRPPPDRTVTAVAVTLRSGRGRARLDRERSDLVATVAHELRSPLTGVKGFVQALLNRWDKLNDEQKKLMLTTVHSDSDRLSRLIAELLDVARIDTGRLQMYPRPSDLGLLVRRIVESVAMSTSRPVDVKVEEGLPDVLVDPDKFAQVVTNLVENAVRHGEGEVRVVVDLLPAAEGDAVRIEVSDQGEGIPPDLRKRVFTKFWTGSTRGGSGLGLYIVNGLVRAHGGTVAIVNAPEGGAVVTTTWPVGETG